MCSRFATWTLFALALSSCNVYSARSGPFSAGGVDPVNFPPGYLGSGGNRLKPGGGSFTEVRAWAGGQPVGYFSFPFSTSQLPPPGSKGTPPDPLMIIDMTGKPVTALPTPKAYDLSTMAPCTPPPNYVYDERTDEVPYDQQNNIFTALPQATYTAGFLPTWSYIPVVAHVPVTGGPINCQGIVAEDELLAARGVQVGAPDGTYLAWAIIDGDAPVYRIGQSQANSFGWGTQKLGWYNHFVLAYLDGGTVPTTMNSDGSTSMVPMALYYPRSQVIEPSGTFAGGAGFGYDVVDAARGQTGYSPVCEVFSYDTGTTMSIDQLPKDAATVKSLYGSTLQFGSPQFIYCFQVQS